ncbi:ras association domain-containing protein 10-like [Halyomorpha halys]|uniref:ras association domain-containing protein 10-like n=1 Tax=Halyomorpha halys TaxID=286706 RepID=UPI0006D4F355|nr:ras association domain-containing protein 10-like [Halyomorpha halys]
MDLPVWVNGEQLWIKGVEKKTTCDDIVKVLLGQEYEEYSLYEKWKGVERKLRGVSKVWKIWKEWGDAQDEVKLTLKRAQERDGRESPRLKSRSRHRKSEHGHRRSNSKPQSIELLLKLILIQGETIQNQLKKLKEKEEEIRQIEEDKHKERVNVLGSNYLLDSYFEKETDSGMVTEYPSENTPPEEEKEYDPNIKTKLELWEKIAKLNRKIEKEEETLVKLFVALREFGENEVIKELKRLRIESDRFTKELESNKENLVVIENTLSERKRYLQNLYTELEESEQETVRLLEIIQSYSCVPQNISCWINEENGRDCILDAIV